MPIGRPSRLAFHVAAGLALALPAATSAQPVGPVGQPQPGQPPPPVHRQPSPPTPVIVIWLPLIVIAVVAAQQQKQRQEEEEEVSTHLSDPAAGFEYKIIRSGVGAFKTPEKFRAMLDEEARAGWELFEKLDHARVRLRRAVSWRERDADLGQDPYRTHYGTGEGKVVLWIVLGVLFGVGVLLAVIALLVSK
jgi:hypothetical protein